MEDLQNIDGCFLVAEAELGDPNFVESVVLLVNHGDEGAFGLVVNRPTQYVLGQAAPAFANSFLKDIPLRLGGPVEQEYLFTLYDPHGMDLPMSPGAKILGPHLVFEPDFVFWESTVAPNLVANNGHFALLAGYSGWGEGQLEEEYTQGAWYVLEQDPGLVFYPDLAGIWTRANLQKGGVYWALARTGYKPSIN